MKRETIYVTPILPLIFLGLAAVMALLGAVLRARGGDDGFGLSLLISGGLIALVVSPVFWMRVAVFDDEAVQIGTQRFAYRDIRDATGTTERVSDLGAVALKRRSRLQDYLHLHLQGEDTPTRVPVGLSSIGAQALAEKIMARVDEIQRDAR